MPYCAYYFSLCIAVVFVFNGPFAQSQHFDLEFDTYDTRKGLSQNLVYDIVQDKKGFIWFGTDEGLNRFDGHEFKIFTHNVKDSASIISNSVHGLVVDDEGVLWIGTSNGLSRYYPETEFIEQLHVDYEDPKKPKGTGVNEIKKDAEGKIWIAYLGSGVDVFDPKTKEFLHYTVHRNDKFQIADDYVISVQFMADGDKMLGTRTGIQVVDKIGHVLSSEEAKKKYPWKDEIHYSITCFHLSANKRTLWIGTELNGFYSIDLKTHEVENFNTNNSELLFNNNIPSIYEDSKGGIWIGGEAVYRFDKKEKSLVAYNEHGILGNIASKNPILSIFEDKDNNIWFGTFRFGALKYNPYNTQILHYHTGQGETSIKNDQILSFNEDAEGNIWVGTDGGGLFKLRKDLRGFDEASLGPKFNSQVIKVIHRDKAGNFWMGTWDGGMMKYHPNLNTLELFNPEKGNFETRHVWDIQEDSLGNFWIGTLRDGLCYFSPKNKTCTYFKNVPEDPTSLINNDIICLYLDSESILWVGTSNGLSVLYPGSKKFVNPETSALNTTILSMYETPDKKMWIGTSGDGIVIMNKKLSIEKRITGNDGLPSSTICAMQSDDHNNIWVSTYNGLVRINHEDMSIAEVPQIAGLQGKEFIPRSSYKSKNGSLLFGGVNGFNLFHPDSLRFNPIPGQIVFTSLTILNNEINPNKTYEGRKILAKSITETDDITLRYKDYSFTLNFASLSFNWQENLQYAYFLENFDEDWQYTTTDKRFIHYTNLDPGEYILRVKASFDGKKWPVEAKPLYISVTPPWWATLWFRISAILLFIFILYTFYKTRVRFLKQQHEKLEELVIQRTQELKKSNEEIQLLLKDVAGKKEQIEEQMHELKQVNEEIGSQRDILELRSIELEKAQSKLKEINVNLELLVDKRTHKLSDTLRELETFLYRASHDLRGPISSMLGLIELSKRDLDLNQYNKTYNDFFQNTVLRLDRTLQKLLQKHTIEKKKLTLEKINKSILLKLLSETVRDIPFYRAEDFQLSVEENLDLKTDRALLGLVLGNLLENAFFFSEKAANKKVSLGVKQSAPDDQVIIVVEDHGPGVKHEIKDKIFTMFYRGHELSTGNGLGLYLVKNVLEKLNGKITLETEEGNYSRFIITLVQNGHEFYS